MKIAFVTPWQEKDGISLYAKELVQGFKSTKELRTFRYFEPARKFPRDMEVMVFPMRRGEEDSWSNWVEDINQYDLMHLQHEYSWWGSYTNPWGNRFQNFLKSIQVPKVVTYHSVDLIGFERPRWGWWGKRQHRKVFSAADQIIVHTQAAKDGLVKNDLKGEKIQVVPIGVSERRTVKDSEALKKFNLTGKRFVSIFGYLNPDKGYEIALAALKNILDLYLVIGGDIQDETNQQYKKDLRVLISQEEKIKNRVVITGYLGEEEMISLMDSSWAILLPRTHVNASHELSLALSQGKAIIASDLPYFKEVNERYECLAICRAGDAGSLQKILEKILADEKFRKNLEQKANQYAKRYSWDFVANETLSIYRAL